MLYDFHVIDISVLDQVSCSLCSETMEREILAIHKGENCPQRIVTCEFCEFPLPAVDLAEHQEVCGNRTELCILCNKYIRLRERYNHEISCNGSGNGILDNTVGSSRDVRAAERDQGAQRRQPPDFSRKRLIFTIAITGIAVLLGSLFFQRKTESNSYTLYLLCNNLLLNSPPYRASLGLALTVSTQFYLQWCVDQSPHLSTEYVILHIMPVIPCARSLILLVGVGHFAITPIVFVG
ncbi:hypothetical protein SO802_032669 [Lithocarpus litseifolius]|uniref:TRAF-type domain-containing protein n=1 Tax=Lithocarpus litseifolius TaxID=425828 RepID=A0AAW2BDW8_9ROSI